MTTSVSMQSPQASDLPFEVPTVDPHPANTALRRSVIEVLRSLPVRRIGFVFLSDYLPFGAYDVVARAVESGAITVKRGVEPDGSYHAGTNTMEFPFTFAAQWWERCLVVHEATHAAFDSRPLSLTTAMGESIAYVAQFTYWLYGNEKQRAAYDWQNVLAAGIRNEAVARVFQLASNLAMYVLASRESRSGAGFKLPDRQCRELMAAVVRVPKYQGRRMQFANGL